MCPAILTRGELFFKFFYFEIVVKSQKCLSKIGILNSFIAGFGLVLDQKCSMMNYCWS